MEQGNRRIFVSLTTFLLVAVSSVGSASPPSKTPDRPQQNAAAIRHLRGVVVSVDPVAKDLTVKRDRGYAIQVITFTAEPNVAPLLGRLKPGDQVTVSYLREHGRLTATEVARVKR
jgi:Cu/Ag efflux protein CusF